MRQIEKIENLDSVKENLKYGLFSKGYGFLNLCLYLIDNMNYDSFQKVFETMTPLFIAKEPQFLKLVLPYLIYYTIRFSEKET